MLITTRPTGVRITHFPAIHCRQGSISYKLEWNGLSMIFSGDTKPNNHIIRQARGVDVLIHEVVVPAEVWAVKNMGIKDLSQINPFIWKLALNYITQVQNSSHTPQGAFGYILGEITPPPRLSIGTHFQVSDDTIESAMHSIRKHYPIGDVTFATDLMVINVSKTRILQRRAVVSEYSYVPQAAVHRDMNVPKYHSLSGKGGSHCPNRS